MKKKYTKKQIQEAIAYWQKKLDSMNEAMTTTSFGNDTHTIPDNAYIVGKFMKYSNGISDVYIMKYTDSQSKEKLDNNIIPSMNKAEMLVSVQHDRISFEDFVDEVERWEYEGNNCKAFIAVGVADYRRSTWRSGAASKARYSNWEEEKNSRDYTLFNLTDMDMKWLLHLIDKVNNAQVKPKTTYRR